MEFHRARIPMMHRALDHRGPPRMIRPSDGKTRRGANGVDGGQIGLRRGGGIGRDAMQQGDVLGARIAQATRRDHDLVQGCHAGGQHHRLAGVGAGLEQIRDQQFVGRDLVEIDERRQLGHRFQIERGAGKFDFSGQTVFGQSRQMGKRQFPIAAGPVLGTARQDLGREHPDDLEKLEFHRVAARIGCCVHKGLGAGEVAAMVAGRFGDEERRGMVCFHLTISKERMAKKRLTTDAGPRSHEPCRRRRFHPGRSA